jgi:uncharacterized repeat protein (TIGR03803 family)
MLSKPIVTLSLLASIALSTFAFAADNETVLYDFCAVTGCADGSSPNAGVIFDSAGNLYSTTYQGGAYNLGTVFELSPGTGGTWTEQVLYSFGKTSTDGTGPESSLVFDASGNLYGTTYAGGHNNLGTVFELSPSSKGWMEKILHSFGSGSTDGANPSAGVVFDKSGNLYGTTQSGGRYRYGTVYQLAPQSGSWKENVLLNCKAYPSDTGASPIGGVSFDAAGNLYGATPAGGSKAYGGVFRLTNTGSAWKFSSLYNFKGTTDGGGSWGTPVVDSEGNVYDTTIYKGSHDSGTVFQLQPNGDKWAFVLLLSFNGKNGASPETGVILDGSGNIYGSTGGGGTDSQGTVFELSPISGGKWEETVLYSFTDGIDGEAPVAPPTLGADGNVFGTASSGGAGMNGVVFELTP